jgi:hypothetical protein
LIKLEGQLKVEVETHLKLLKHEFVRYFPDLENINLWNWKMTRNPFRSKVDIIPFNLKEEFLELKFNSGVKDDFETMHFEPEWVKYLRRL